jgi:hypothetical protein
MICFIGLTATRLLQLVCRLKPAVAWHYTGDKRDLRLDFLRGFAVLAMVVDHIGGERSWLYAITGGDRFFISVAELFVFISGLLMGYIYANVITRQGLAEALMKCLRRAWMLYLLTVTLTLCFASLLLELGLWWAPEMTAAAWPDFIMSVLTLHRTFYMTDILLLYTLLLLAAVPALFFLAHGYSKSVLACAWGLWALWQLVPQYAQFPWPIAGNRVFNFPAWQVLFMTAMVIGYHRQQLAQRMTLLFARRVLILSSALVVGTLLLYIYQPLGTDNVVLINRLFGKADLRLGRLLVFASFFSFALALLTVAWQPLSRALNWLFLPLGQNALPAYTLHLGVLALLGKVGPSIVGTSPTTAWHHTLLQTIGIGCLWAALKLQPTVVRQYREWVGKVTGLLAVKRTGSYMLGTSV